MSSWYNEPLREQKERRAKEREAELLRLCDLHGAEAIKTGQDHFIVRMGKARVQYWTSSGSLLRGIKSFTEQSPFNIFTHLAEIIECQAAQRRLASASQDTLSLTL